MKSLIIKSSRLEHLHTQIKQEFAKWADALKKDLPFRVLKEIRNRITELHKEMEKLS